MRERRSADTGLIWLIETSRRERTQRQIVPGAKGDGMD
jgi:hypothetical protein